ncbi:CFA47 protein, partial [Bucco capensis]|nr:CFA47 protein [Bucco capensis]
VAGSAAVELPVKFWAQRAGLYHCQIVLSSSWDVRAYQLGCVVSSEPAEAQLHFLTSAYQPLTQDIPISNMSSQEWQLEAVLEGEGFCGPPAITVPVGETAMYPLTFKPVAEC